MDEYHSNGTFIKSDSTIGCDLKDKKLGFCTLLKSNDSGLYATKDLSLAVSTSKLKTVYYAKCIINSP